MEDGGGAAERAGEQVQRDDHGGFPAGESSGASTVSTLSAPITGWLCCCWLCCCCLCCCCLCCYLSYSVLRWRLCCSSQCSAPTFFIRRPRQEPLASPQTWRECAANSSLCSSLWVTWSRNWKRCVGGTRLSLLRVCLLASVLAHAVYCYLLMLTSKAVRTKAVRADGFLPACLRFPFT